MLLQLLERYWVTRFFASARQATSIAAASSVAPEALMDEENGDELPTPTQCHKYRKTMAKELTIEYG